MNNLNFYTFTDFLKFCNFSDFLINLIYEIYENMGILANPLNYENHENSKILANRENYVINVIYENLNWQRISIGLSILINWFKWAVDKIENDFINWKILIKNNLNDKEDV